MKEEFAERVAALRKELGDGQAKELARLLGQAIRDDYYADQALEMAKEKKMTIKKYLGEDIVDWQAIGGFEQQTYRRKIIRAEKLFRNAKFGKEGKAAGFVDMSPEEQVAFTKPEMDRLEKNYLKSEAYRKNKDKEERKQQRERDKEHKADFDTAMDDKFGTGYEARAAYEATLSPEERFELDEQEERLLYEREKREAALDVKRATARALRTSLKFSPEPFFVASAMLLLDEDQRPEIGGRLYRMFAPYFHTDTNGSHSDKQMVELNRLNVEMKESSHEIR